MTIVDMKKRREAAMKVFDKKYSVIETDPAKPRYAEMKARLNQMTEQEFHNFMVALQRKEDYVSMVSPNFTGSKLEISHLDAVGQIMGIEFYEQVVFHDEATGLTIETPHKSLVGMGPVRRQVQTQESGIAVAGTRMRTDDLTDQVAGEAAVSKITAPEIGGLEARDMPAVLAELVSVRGGNLSATNTLDREIIDTGEGSLKTALADGSRAKISDTINALMTSGHIQNNI